MKILIFISPLFLCVYFLSSCKPYYGLANYGSQGSYLTKPVYNDTNQTVSASAGVFLNKNHLTGFLQVTKLGFFPAAVVSFGLSYHIR